MNKNINTDIGLTLRKIRHEFNYTQQNVADSLNISREAYRKWEENRVDFSISQLKKISFLYDIPVLRLIIVPDERLNRNNY